MLINDLMITNILGNSFNKVNTGYIILDLLYFIIISSIIIYLLTPHFKNYFLRRVNGFLSKFDYTYSITFSSSDKESSKRYRSIMHYISRSNNPSVKALSEIVNWKYNKQIENFEESSVYRVNQSSNFVIDKNLGIDGCVYCRDKECNEINGKTNYTEYNYLKIFSKKTNILNIEKWVDNRVDEYNQFIKNKSCDKQQLIEISWNTKEKDLDICYNPWKSNTSFDNRFFSNKDEIITKINFFLENPEWYNKRGIPYTLGFLLWGEPGCGKTGFIKALMNLTERHGISIKLNSKFDMNRLREIIYDDEICEDLIIPQQNRILIFEDIDCMGDIVKDRELKENKPNSDKIIDSTHNIHKVAKMSETEEFINIMKTENETNFNNNLSFFLNILDGLQECHGRIIIMTTNKPEQLDKALIRPGRIDYNIHFTKATITDVNNILQFYWSKPANKLPSEINEYFSHAEIVNYCRTSESIDETIKKLIDNVHDLL
jgi:hypothetical protein